MRARILPLLLVAGLVVLALQPVAGATATDDDDAVRVVLLSIDALDPAELAELNDGGNPIAPTLASLRAAGTWWEQARAVMASETLPNHVAMATGTYPGTNQIPGNDGRLQPGDTENADPDLGVPEAREATSLMAAIEDQCSELRTVTSLSKEYVWRTFQGEGDAVFDQPSFNIPGSGHAPESATVPFILQQENEAPIDFLFANLGDHDRAGHVDATGAVADGPDGVADGARAAQRAALTQVDAWVQVIQQQLQAAGEWERTVLVITSDHSMNFTISADPRWNIDTAAALELAEVGFSREPGSTFLVSNNGGASFVYLVDDTDPEREALLEAAYDALAALPGVEETLYRQANASDPDGAVLSTVHPDWNLHQTPRAGEILVLAQDRYRMGSIDENPIPGNHGHTSTRHITALVTGGWDGIVTGQSIAPSDPDAINEADDTAALPEQVEQVDWAPTIGWLLGIEDPGVAAGGDPQWEGRVLEEAFSRRPGTLACSGVTTQPVDDGAADDGGGAVDDVTQDDGEDLAATGAGTGLAAAAALGLAAVVGRRRRGAERT